MGITAPLQAGISYSAGAGGSSAGMAALSNPWTAAALAAAAATAYGTSPTVRHKTNDYVSGQFKHWGNTALLGGLLDPGNQSNQFNQRFAQNPLMGEGQNPQQSLFNLSNLTGQNQNKAQPKQQNQQEQQNPYLMPQEQGLFHNPYQGLNAIQYRDRNYVPNYGNQSPMY